MTSTGTDDEARTIRPFAAVLQDIGNGTAAAEASRELADLTEAVIALGKKGTLTLTLTVAPASKGLATNLVVAAEVKAKPPTGEAPASVFFTDADGNLTRNDPNQPMLPLRGLTTPREATA